MRVGRRGWWAKYESVRVRSLRWFFVVLIGSLVFAGANIERASQSAEATDEKIDISQLEIQALRLVSQLTGAESPAQTHEPWNIYGTDLGFPIEHEGRLYVVFGDTWGRGDSEGPDWRSNTMAIIEPHPVHGYVITDVIVGENGEARELLSSLKAPRREYTVIPTAGIARDGRMYLHYMSINDWVDSGWGYKHPAVNGAGLAYSDDHGETWVKDGTARWAGDTGFTQAAMVESGDDIYLFGTPAGRFGPLRLLKTPGNNLLDPDRYRFWTGESWSPDAAQAVDLLPAPVGELSVRWSPYHERWFMMYLNDVDHTIVLRTSERLEGPWDDERIVATAAEYPALYAPYMLPITGPEVYFTMSMYRPYQVFVMRFTF